MKITRELLLDIAPSARPEIVDGMASDAGNALLVKYGIIKTEHLIDFLAQTAEETGGYNRLEENLFYTSVKRLRQVWPKRFTSDAAAQPYVRNPEKLANLVYRATGQFRTTPTLAVGDVKVSKDFGAYANITTLPTVAPAGGSTLQISLSAAEMTADTVAVKFVDQAGAEWNDVLFVINTIS